MLPRIFVSLFNAAPSGCRPLGAVLVLVFLMILPSRVLAKISLDYGRDTQRNPVAGRAVATLPANLPPAGPACTSSVQPPTTPAPLPAPGAKTCPAPNSLQDDTDFDLRGEALPSSHGELLVPAGKPLPGAILPNKRIVAFYGNPMSPRMGVLGEFDKDELLALLRAECRRWAKADPTTKVQPALHLIAVVAQGTPGRAGMYRKLMTDDLVKEVYSWAHEAGALLFIDIQTGHDNIRSILPRFEWILKNPDVHLGIDPEFNLGPNGAIPGTRIGSYDATDVNAVSAWLADLVRRYNLPPKILTVHRFTRNGVTNARNIVVRPEVQIVMHMDGWGPPALKRATYRDYVASEPVQFTGFKLFFHNDTKEGDPLMTPQDVLSLRPRPLYIQYQ